VQERCPPEKTIRHSPLAAVSGSAGASPSQFRPSSRVPRPVLSRCLRKRSLLKQSEKLEGASPDAQKIFRQRKSAALQKSHHSLIAIRHSPLAVVSGSAGASPSQFRPSSRVPRPVLSRCLRKRSLLKQAEKLEGASPDAQKIFRQCKSAALQKKLFATRHSLLAAVSGSAGASPSHFIPPSSCVPRSVLFFVPCPMSPAPLKLMRVDELWKMRYGFMGKTQIDG
jgi:hypothetical protein